MTVDTYHHTFSELDCLTRAQLTIHNRPGITINELRSLMRKSCNIALEPYSELFLVLLEGGYFFSKSGKAYPPEDDEIRNEKYEKFVKAKGFEEIDTLIFSIIDELGADANMMAITRNIAGNTQEYAEIGIKYRIGILFMEKAIIAIPSNENPKFLAVNRELIEEELG